jgi:cadmium resistance protein CadD (predicted permease)
LPIWAICEKYPLWETVYGTTHSIGVGGILALIVIIIVFRRAVFKFIKDKLKITHAPPLAVWLILIALSYILVFIGQFMYDMVIILWMGFIGCAIGTLLTFIAENKFGKKENEDGKN